MLTLELDIRFNITPQHPIHSLSPNLSQSLSISLSLSQSLNLSRSFNQLLRRRYLAGLWAS